jgi:hypothetical protein
VRVEEWNRAGICPVSTPFASVANCLLSACGGPVASPRVVEIDHSSVVYRFYTTTTCSGVPLSYPLYLGVPVVKKNTPTLSALTVRQECHAYRVTTWT